MAAYIYIADDETNIRELLTSFLQSDGYQVRAFETGDALMEEFQRTPCDLVILDVMMPGTDGLTCCKQMRTYTDVPIILLTAKDSELDFVQGITFGSDDYLTKPFRPTVLLMRVKSLLRRMEMNRGGNPPPSMGTELGDLRFSPEENMIYCRNSPVHFSQTELKMLAFMMEKPGKAYSREELLEKIWDYNEEVETRVTDETLRRIRRKLSAAESNVQVQTIWGFGYKLQVGEDAT